MNLQGKVAIITGGAVRIGRALTLGLAEAGCDVFIHYGRSEEEAIQTKGEAEALGVRAAAYAADLRNAAEVETIVEKCLRALGRADILVNSAAVFPDDDSFATTTAAQWDDIMAVNARAPFLLSRAFAQHVGESGRTGKIININDARIPKLAADHFVYRLAKRALWDMTLILAQELAPDITVNGVALGAILPPPGKDKSYLEQLAQEQIPLKRPGNPDLVVANVRHLLQQDFVTGVIVPLDGGQFLK